MAVAACGLPWCEDSSNDDLSIPRNALRRKWIPGLVDAVGRDVSTAAARTRQLLEEDADALEQFMRASFSREVLAADRLSRTRLRASPRALSRRALSAWLGNHGLMDSLSAAALDNLLDTVYSAQSESRQSAGEQFIRIRETELSLECDLQKQTSPGLEIASLEAGESLILPTGGSWRRSLWMWMPACRQT